MVKNPPANVGKVRDKGSIPGSGNSPGGSMATHSSILAWRILWTEEPGGLPSIRSQSRTQLSDLVCTDREGAGEEREAGSGLTILSQVSRPWGSGDLASCLVI